MKKYLFLILSVFIFSCNANESQSKKDTAILKLNESDTTVKFGDWELDNEGNKYREDHQLSDFITGYEVLKYTRTDGDSADNSTKTKFTFCSDGTMQYYHRSRSSAFVTGSAGKDDSEKEVSGTWKAVENGSGLKLILLRSNKDKTIRYMEVKVVGGTKLRLLWYNEWHEFLMKKINC